MGTLAKRTVLGGGINGKVGPVIVSKWKGIDVIKEAPPRNRTNNSSKQIVQKARFGTAIEFVRHLSGLYSVTYKLKAQKMTARNSAVGQIVSDAITGDYPNFQIDFPKVLVSRGTLEPVDATVAAAAGKITWTWVPNVGINGASELDQSVVVVYCPQRKQALYKINAGTRIAGTATLDVTPFQGLTVVTYLAFTAIDQGKVSDSRFTGELLVN
jgi:hypothetical protein